VGAHGVVVRIGHELHDRRATAIPVVLQFVRIGVAEYTPWLRMLMLFEWCTSTDVSRRKVLRLRKGDEGKRPSHIVMIGSFRD